MSKRLGIVLLLTGLAACAPVGPNYVLPPEAKVNAPAAQGAFVGAALPSLSQAPVPDGWWKLYDDPTLDGLEEEALKANTDLRVAAANLARAEDFAKEADSAKDPKFGASVAAERSQLSGESYLFPAQLPSQYLGDVGLELSYQIDLVGRLKQIAEAAHADTEASLAGRDLARITVAADVARSYVESCAAGHEIDMLGRTLALQQKTLAVTRKLTGGGRGTAIDVTRAQAAVDQAAAIIPPLAARRRTALYKLTILVGRPPAEFPAAVAGCTQPPHLRQAIPVGDGAALLKRRPDVRQAERLLAGATARIGVATASLYPTITLGAGAGSSGLMGDLGDPKAQYWSLGSLISWTLPGGSERARIAAADSATVAALAHFDGIVLNALRETETALTVYTHDLDRNASLRAVRDEASETARQSETLYRVGRSPILTGLDAQKNLATAETALAASEDQLAADQITLFLALGGGWGTAD